MRISDWSSDVCSSDLRQVELVDRLVEAGRGVGVGAEGQPLAFEQLDHLALGHMSRSVERHMFEEMGEAALVVGFGEAADVEARADDDAALGRAVFEQRIFHPVRRSEEHTSELQSLMRISYAVFCLKKKKNNTKSPS